MEKVKIYNNLTRSKENFSTQHDNKVLFYSCGPTTYDFIHVGNAMALVVGDLIYRAMSAFGYDVTFVRNFTDIDDKIIAKAHARGVDPLKHSAEFVKECLVDMKALNLKSASFTPKVSETIPEIIEMIKELMSNGSAYEVDGEVLFHVPSFKEYGKLSKKDLDSLLHGARVEIKSNKKNPADFVLWKPSKDGEPAWDSPWGNGRPGWHIECSAMAKKFLGDTIDIHHGGIDLMFPHHENEIAQSESCNHTTFSRFWCHNEFLNFGDEKMSKSLGNVITTREFTIKFGGEILRQIILSSHYRAKLAWSEEIINKAVRDVERIHNFLVHFENAKVNNFSDLQVENGEGVKLITDTIKDILPSIKSDLANDFNTAGAISHLFSMIRLINREFLDENNRYQNKKKLTPQIVILVENILSFFKEATGLIYDNPQAILTKVKMARKNLNVDAVNLDDQNIIDDLIKRRGEARHNKDWGEADKIRDELSRRGVVVKDNPDGSVTWTYK